MNRQLRGWCCLLAIAVVACHHRDALGIYVSTAGMTSTHSSDLGGYPAQNAFDSAISGYRADWTFATGTVNGDAGYVLRTDVHGNWHSLNDPNPKQSPSGTMAREWIAADFGVVHKMRGADFWNSNWNVISQTRAAKSVSIDVSADGSSWTNVWSGDLSQAPGTLPDLMYDGTTYIHPILGPGAVQFGLLATDRVSFGGAVDARYVVINMHTNQGGDPYFALEEVRFLAIPEPASALMAIVGLAWGIVRRRK